ncbi:MAG: Acetyltransferase domain [Acidobacteriales bacterium]|nr:Acetyltransferase domain [Terriglobales bacterium]
MYSISLLTRESDKNELIKTFLQQAYPGRFAFKFPERWEWLYGRHAVSVVASADGAIIGHQGLLRTDIAMNGNSCVFHWAIDNFVLAHFRNMGVSSEVHRFSGKQCFGILSTWMSAKNVDLKLKTGDYLVGELKIYEQSVSVSSCHSIRSDEIKISVPDPSTIAESAFRALRDRTFYVKRTESYCKWRYAAQPFAEYWQISVGPDVVLVRKCGYKRFGTGLITDIFCEDKSKIAELRSLGMRYLFGAGCTTVRTSGTTELECLQLEAEGWRPRSVYPITTNLPAGFFGKAFENAYISFSDSDMDQFPW